MLEAQHRDATNRIRLTRVLCSHTIKQWVKDLFYTGIEFLYFNKVSCIHLYFRLPDPAPRNFSEAQTRATLLWIVCRRPELFLLAPEKRQGVETSISTGATSSCPLPAQRAPRACSKHRSSPAGAESPHHPCPGSGCGLNEPQWGHGPSPQPSANVLKENMVWNKCSFLLLQDMGI